MYLFALIPILDSFLPLLNQEKLQKNVIVHCLQAFNVLGVPKQFKTDNGTGYTSKSFKRFCQQFQVSHITEIPYNPQGQGMVEHAHHTIKIYLQKKKKKEGGATPLDT